MQISSGFRDIPENELNETLEKIRNLPGINSAIIERQGFGIVFSKNGRTGTQIRSVSPEINQDQGFNSYFEILSGVFDIGDEDSIMLGRAVAEKLGAEVGDKVKILTVLTIGNRTAPKITTFTVKGIFSTGYQDLDKLWAYINISTGRKILPDSSIRQFIGIKISDPYGPMEDHIMRITSLIPDNWTFYRINMWNEIEENQYKSFETTKAMLIFIMFLIVIVASVNVSSTMVMIVMEKNMEIGILKSLGTGPGDITNAFLITGFLTGVFGAFIGILTGLLIAVNINEIISGIEFILNNTISFFNSIISVFVPVAESKPVVLLDPVYYLQKIPIRIYMHEVLGIGFFTIFLSTVASYLPAKRAGKIKPLQIIQKI
jgi:lipoprotein-releasing system permease protein